MESKEIVARGHFWLEDPDSAVAGELRYSPEGGATVYLYGVLEPIPLDHQDTPARYAIVRGHTDELGWVWLREAIVTRQYFGTCPSASELHSNLVIHSSSANDFSRAPILKLRAEIDCLHEWLGVSGFSFTSSPDFRTLQMEFRAPIALEFEARGDRVAFAFERTGPSMKVIQKEMTVAQTTYVSITFAEPAALENSVEKLLALKDFIALAVGRTLSWRSVEAKFAVISTEAAGNWANILDRPVGTGCREIIHPLEMLFTFHDVQDRFAKALSAWLTIGNEVRPFYLLYSATTRGQKLYSEHRLFNFFQALESYHRTRNEIDEETKQKVISLKEKMLSACSQDERDWVRDKLQHLGQLTAVERVKALVEQFQAQWIFEPDWEKAVRRIKDLRNYFTHYSKKPPTENLDSASIYNDGSRLQVLCEQILLVEIGFTPNEAAALLQRNRRLQRLTVS
jgi:hypothetical protein